MDNKFAILCMPDDFYLGDALCREIEKSGVAPLFNLRDSKNPLYPNFREFTKVDILIAVINKKFVANKSFAKIVESHTCLPLDSDKTFLLKNDGIEKFPKEWEECILLDARKGLELTIVEKVLDYKKCVSLELINPKESQVSGVNTIQDKKSAIDDNEISQNPEVDKTETKHNSAQEKLKTSTVSYPGIKEDFNPLLALKTVMTSKPNCEWVDEVTEAYKVPIFKLLFERGERVTDRSILKSIELTTVDLERAMKYLYGNGVPKDENKAFSILKKAISKGSEDGMVYYALGVFYECGVGCSRSLEDALDCYAKAYNCGLEMAQFRMLLMKYFINSDSEELEKILEDRRNEGDLEAIFMLGVLSEDSGNYSGAYELYSEAAELGFAKSQNALGCMLYNGKGVSQNKGMAIEWVKLSSQQDFLMAKWNLLVNSLNCFDLATPEREDLNKLINSYVNLEEVIQSPYHQAIRYNFGILRRRGCATHEAAISFFLREPYYNPYIDEYMKFHEQEKSRRARKAVAITGLNFLGRVVSALNDEKWIDRSGGYFDKDRSK